MDRPIIYTGEVPRSADFLGLAKDTLYGLAYMSGATVGTGTAIAGLAIAPTGPASLSFTIGTGSIYIPETVDATAYSTLGTDTHNVIKQGILNDPVTLTITPPATSGFSQVFLVQVGYLDSDITSIVPPYFNSVTPGTPFNGAGGAGGSQNTVRAGKLVVQLKAGTAAATGSQATPSPDAGFTPVWIVTVANGATTITSANWVQHSAAPFFPALSQIPAAVQNSTWIWAGTFGGGANALTAAISPAPLALVAGLTVRGIAAAKNTGATTLNLNGLGAVSVTRDSGVAMTGSEIITGYEVEFNYNGTNWVQSSPLPATLTAAATNIVQFTSTTSWTVPAGVFSVKDCRVWGAGGGGGGAGAAISDAGAGGGSGGFSEQVNIPVTPGSTVTVTIGAGGISGTSTTNGGTGGTTSFGSFCSASGGGGGQCATTSISSAGGTGGSVFTGQFNIVGNAGGGPVSIPSPNPWLSGAGGGAPFSAASSVGNQGTAGNAGSPPGGGGNGGVGTGAGGNNGGVGARGLVVIEY